MDSIVESALADLRKKIKDSDDEIQCNMEEAFLKCFLRYKDFDSDEALACIKLYYKLRKDFPKQIWPRGKGIQWMEPYVALNNCTVFPQKNPIDNTWIFGWRKGQWRPEERKYTLADYLTWSLYMTEYILYMRPDCQEDDSWTYIMDVSGFEARHLPYCDVTVIQAYANIMKGALPLKVKAIHFINVPVVYHYVLKMFKYLLDDKLRNRIYVHRSVSGLQKTIDPSVLPEEYGGSGKPFDSQWLFEEMLPHEQLFVARSYNGFKE